MKMIKIDKNQWANGVEALKTEHLVYGPSKENTGYQFKRLKENALPDFTFFNTTLSPKFLIFPQSQDMFRFSLDESEKDHHELKTIPVNTHPKVILGIRPCDAKAFEMVKLNFDTPTYKDPYWLDLYHSTTFVGLACQRPKNSCFCTSLDSGPFNEEGLDVLLCDVDDGYIAKAITLKGEKLLEKAGFSGQLDDASPFLEKRKRAEERISKSLSTHRLRGQSTLDLYEAPFWEDIAFACINCGVCTYSCPTCWCFDMIERVHKTGGLRKRIWDSCMYPLFTRHTTGHNPRSSSLQRLRQRFMHKLKYFVDKYDAGIMCVGCGRCVEHCPSNIDIRKVCLEMNAYGADSSCSLKDKTKEN